MKNVIISTSLGSGGAERILHRLLSTWNRPQEFIVFNLTSEGQFSQKIRDLGIPVYDLNLFKKPWNAFKFFTLLFGQDVRSVWGWMYHANLIALVIRLMIKPQAKLIWNIRHSLYSLGQEKTLTRWVIRLNALFSFYPDNILFNSHLSLKQHRDHGFSSEALNYVPNGFDLENFNKLSRTQNSSVTIGHVGRFHPMKNQKQMLEVFVNLAATHPELHFLLVGKGMEASNSELTRLIPDSLKDRFEFKGEQTDVYPYYFKMDLFVLFSSWGEAFPNVLVEAALAGAVPVSSDVGDAQIILGSSELITPIGDQKNLKEKIEGILKLTAQERLKKNLLLKARLEKDYSIESVAGKFSAYLGS